MTEETLIYYILMLPLFSATINWHCLRVGLCLPAYKMAKWAYYLNPDGIRCLWAFLLWPSRLFYLLVFTYSIIFGSLYFIKKITMVSGQMTSLFLLTYAGAGVIHGTRWNKRNSTGFSNQLLVSAGWLSYTRKSVELCLFRGIIIYIII